ncbi:MAG TPA: hypothetical protein VH951_04405 [Dehalococcoidia bacterium]|jgi:hypothetical protein
MGSGDVGSAEARQPVAVAAVADGEDLMLTPRFPFIAGREYAVVVQSGDGVVRERRITMPGVVEAAETRITFVYPAASDVPVNLLRFYVHFSAPMSTDQAAKTVSLLRASDREPLADVFRFEPELWDRERRRLTLLLDPARIKRGLVPNLEAGYPLRQGETVILRIDGSFRDAEGRPLVEGFECRYEVGPELRGQIDPRRWSLTPPAAGGTEPLVVIFDRLLDHALASRCLSVVDSRRAEMSGNSFVETGGRAWVFRPDAGWAHGRYTLVIAPGIEDVAGNSPVREFDRDLSAGAAFGEPVLSLPFDCA